VRALEVGIALAGELADRGFDLLEYPAPIHPVVWMGRTLTVLERWAPASGARRQLLYGAFLALAIPAFFAAAAALLAHLASGLGPASLGVEALARKSTFAVRELGRAAARVGRALEAGDLAAAREGLRSLCSRDPSRLDAERVAAAAVESVAETASDSVVAPLLFYAAFGLPGAFFYRAANTLDARIGYHGRYEWLGKAAARLDDLLNLVPARVTALLLLAAGLARGADARRGWRILRRDAGNTESPNAGRPMAAMAGLLGVELEKVDHYRLGDRRRPVDGDAIRRAWSTVVLASLLAVGLSLAALGALDGLRG
jgi:adenosylcobinamide-phosphate synthase